MPCVVPLGIVELAGVTVIEVRLGSPQFSVAGPVTELEIAVIVMPSITCLHVAKPAELTEAAPGEPELHVAEFVRSWVELSVKVPVAVNCWVRPLGMVTGDGVAAIDFNAGGPTLIVPTSLKPP